MKRRLPKGVEYAQDGPNGRPAREIQHRWISAAKRMTHKRERREGQVETDDEVTDMSVVQMVEDYVPAGLRPAGRALVEYVDAHPEVLDRVGPSFTAYAKGAEEAWDWVDDLYAEVNGMVDYGLNPTRPDAWRHAALLILGGAIQERVR